MHPSSADDPAVRPRLLVVLRHARAESFAEEDHVRRLTDRGRRDATATGAWLGERLGEQLGERWGEQLGGPDVPPVRALVSSAARARETWELVAAGLPGEPDMRVEDDLYSASADTVLDAVRRVEDDVEVVVYVGHNPTAASLAQALEDGEPDVDAFIALSRGFPPGAAALLQVPVPWSALDAAVARLVDVHAPEG